MSAGRATRSSRSSRSRSPARPRSSSGNPGSDEPLCTGTGRRPRGLAERHDAAEADARPPPGAGDPDRVLLPAPALGPPRRAARPRGVPRRPRRLARLRDWGVGRADVAERLPAKPDFAEAVQAIYRAYADARGKPRFGDKTPSYMQELDLLERAFPGARYVHLIRDGRDAAALVPRAHPQAELQPGAPAQRRRVRRPVAARGRGRAALRRRAGCAGATTSSATRTSWPTPRRSCARRASSSSSSSTRRCSSTTWPPTPAPCATTPGSPNRPARPSRSWRDRMSPSTGRAVRGGRRRPARRSRLRARPPAAERRRAPRVDQRGGARRQGGDVECGARGRPQEPGLAPSPGLQPAQVRGGRDPLSPGRATRTASDLVADRISRSDEDYWRRVDDCIWNIEIDGFIS